MDPRTFLENFGTIAEAPEGIERLRELIIDFAITGRLLASKGTRTGKYPDHWTVDAAKTFFTTRSGNSKLIKGKLHNQDGPGRFRGFSASGQDIWLDTWEHEGDAAILSAVGARCGKAFPAKGRWSAIANTHIIWLQDARVFSPFAMLILNNERFWIRSGTAQPFVKVKASMEQTIGLPPLVEQETIVRRVEELMSLCNELEAAKDKRDSLRTAARKSAIDAVSMATTPRELDSAWVRISKNCSIFYDSQDAISDLRATVITLIINKATNSSQPAEIAPIGNVATIFNGDRSANYPSKEHRVDSGVPFINAGHLRNGQIDFSQMDYITQERFNLLKGGKLVNGDVLFCLRGSLGKSAVVEGIETGTVASSLAIIRPSPRLHSRYLLRFLESQACLKQISRFDNGTAQPNLSARNLAKFELPVPSPDAQESMVKSIDELMQLCDELERSLVTRLTIQQNLAMSVSQFV